MKFQKCIEYFSEWGHGKYSARTLEVYVGHLKQFVAYIDNKDIEAISLFDDVITYVRKLERQGLADNTINIRMIAIRQCWKAMYGLENQLGIKLPFSAEMIPVKSGVVPTSHKPISEKEFNVLITTLSEKMVIDPFIKIRDITIFYFLYDTGLRVSELCDLDISDLDMERRSAKVRSRKRRDRFKHREVYWTFETHLVLSQYLQVRSQYSGKEALFINQRFHERLTTRSIQRGLKGYCKDARLVEKPITPHSFRHSVGERAAKNQMYPPLLQSLLGHKNPNSSQVYYNIHNESLRVEYHKKIGDSQKFSMERDFKRTVRS